MTTLSNKIAIGEKYLLNKKVVIPFDGEKANQLGLSAGFVHFRDLTNRVGYCGVNYFAKHAIRILE